MFLRLTLTLLLFIVCVCGFTQFRDPRAVLIVVNSNSAVSQEIGNYYAAQRGIPNMISISVPDSSLNTTNENIQWTQFQTNIQAPIQAYLDANPNILYVVLTKGVPIRILNHPTLGFNTFDPARGRVPSVDATLAGIKYETPANEQYNFVTQGGAVVGRAWLNTYWRSTTSFQRPPQVGYLVTRLDGYTAADAKALVDRSKAARGFTGRVLLDADAARGFSSVGLQPRGQTVPVSQQDFNSDIQRSSGLLPTLAPAATVELDLTNSFLGNRTDLLAYVSWGSNDGAFSLTSYRSLRFVPGAIADTAVSTSGRTFLPAVGGQSLIADLIQQGVTGVKGTVDEPFLNGIGSPTVILPNYVRGYNLAEAFYSGSRYVGFQDVIIGDPLCRPFGATIYGNLQLADFIGSTAGMTAQLEVIENGTVIRAYPLTLRSTNTPGVVAYSIPTNLNSRTCDLRFSMGRFLAKRVNGVDVSDYVLQNVELGNGDTNGDGMVDDADLTELILGFGGAGNPGGIPQPDLNGDGTVDDADLTILILNFGASGD